MEEANPEENQEVGPEDEQREEENEKVLEENHDAPEINQEAPEEESKGKNGQSSSFSKKRSSESSSNFGKTMRSTGIRSPKSTYSNDPKSKLSIFSSRFGSQSRFNQLSSAKSNLLPNSMELKKIQEELIARTEELERLLSTGKYREAEAVNLRIEKLKEEELVVQTSEFMKKNKSEAESLKRINEEQLAKFSEEWERIIEDHKKNVEKIEKDFVADQQTEISEFNEKLKGFQIPPVKLSSSTLNLQKVLNQMLKQKKYGHLSLKLTILSIIALRNIVECLLKEKF